MVATLQFIFWIFSNNVLETVMIYGNKMEMKQMVNRYQLQLSSDKNSFKIENSEDILAQLSYEWDGNLTLIDTDKKEFRTTVPMRGAMGGAMIRNQLIDEVSRRFGEVEIGNIEAYIRDNRGSKDALIIFVGRVSENQLLFSEKPLNLIQESSKLVSRYILFSGVLTVLIGSFAILLFSKKLTQPIIEIEEQATRIASLKFEPQNKVVQNDEIGSLGQAVNQIAKALKETIDELGEVNSRLKDEIENERRIERMRRQFVSNVSHELKTPISMIVGYADGLKFGIAKNPEQIGHYCEVILSESEKMNGLINDLLDMSAYQDGHLPMQLKRFNLSQSVVNTAILYQDKVDNLDSQLLINVGSDIEFFGDQLRLEQVLRNLIGNAIKHLSENGRLIVGLEQIEQEVIISVYNDGSTISDEEIEAIWMSFYRGAQSREKQMDGFGIGLALVREIVEKHKGKAYSENNENGVTFVIKLPIISE